MGKTKKNFIVLIAAAGWGLLYYCLPSLILQLVLASVTVASILIFWGIQLYKIEKQYAEWAKNAQIICRLYQEIWPQNIADAQALYNMSSNAKGYQEGLMRAVEIVYEMNNDAFTQGCEHDTTKRKK